LSEEGSSSGRALLQIYLLVTGVYLFWGGNFVFSKIALAEIPPPLAAGMRTAVAAVLLYVVYQKSRTELHVPLQWREMPRLFFVGSMGIAVNQVCFLGGIALTSAGHAAMIIGLTPFMVLGLAWHRGQEVFTGRRVLGLCVALAGIGFLQKPSASSATASLWGDLLIIGAGASFAVYTVYGKELTREHGGMATVAYSYIAGALTLAPATAWYGARFDFGAVTGKAWMSFAYMTLVSSVACYIGWVYALKRLTASRVSAFSYLQPLVATGLAVPLLGEPVTASLVGGGSMIMAGFYLSEKA
jgi:drug/metabolite transporter (DMT)-like permease